MSKLSDAEAEAEETRVWLEFALNCGYIQREAFDELDASYDKTGQLTTFVPYEGPCYRCLYPTRRRPSSRPAARSPASLASCPDPGPAPGKRGAQGPARDRQHAGRPALLFDALETEFTELKLRRDPNCPVCSDAAVQARAEGRRCQVDGVDVDAPFLMTMTGLAGKVSPEARA